MCFPQGIDWKSASIYFQTKNFRTPIPGEEPLAITLQYLAIEESYESLMCQFRINRTTISRIIQEVYTQLTKLLYNDVIIT